jgi:hypothetical protein
MFGRRLPLLGLRKNKMDPVFCGRKAGIRKFWNEGKKEPVTGKGRKKGEGGGFLFGLSFR